MSIFSFIGSLLGLGGGTKRQGIGISKASSNEGLPIIYGHMRVPAIKVFKTVSRENAPIVVTNFDVKYDPMPGAGDEERKKAKEWLHRIDVWGQGPITGIAKYFIDGENHTVSRLNSKPYFRAVGYYGETDQTAFNNLSAVTNRWTSAHRGRGVAYSATRFFAHGKKPQYNGEPEVAAEIIGKAVYDPRLDSTQPGGVGSHRADDSATWVYSDNWALGLLDYERSPSGRNLTNAEVNFPSYMVGADKCDVAETIPTPLTNITGGAILNYWDRLGGIFSNIGIGAFYPSYREWQGPVETTQKRHVLNIALDPKDKVKTNVLKLLNGIRADLPFSQGQYKLVMEDIEAATVYDFDEDTIIGGMKIEYGGRSKRLNRVTIEYQNRNKDFKEDTASWPDLQSAEYASFLAEDQGETLHQTIPGDGIAEFYQAQDLAEFLVRSSRVGIVVSLKLAPVGSLLEPGDVIGLTHSTPGWVIKWFRVETVKVNEDFTADIKAVEYDATIYPWSTKTNEPLNPSDDLPNPWDEPAAVANLAAVAGHTTKDDGTVISGFNVTWDAPTNTGQLDYIEIAWKLDGATDYTNVSRVPEDNISATLTGMPDGQTYDIRVSYRTSLGQISVVSEVTEVLAAAAGTKLGGIEGGATVGDPFGASFNLLGSDAGPEVAYSIENNYILDMPIIDFNLAVGDKVSFAVDIKSDGGGDVARMGISYFTDVGFLSSITGDITNATTTYIRADASLPVPVGATRIRVWVGFLVSSTGTKFAKNAMLNRGPVALPYVAPYEDGSTVGGVIGTNISVILPSTVVQDQGNGTNRNPAHGLSPNSLRDGDAHTFINAWQNIPTVLFLSGGMSYDPIGLDSAKQHIQDYSAVNTTTSGFTASLKIKEIATGITTETDGDGAGAETAWHKDVGHTGPLWQAGKENAAEAWDDKYNFKFSTTPLIGGDVDYDVVDVRLYTNNGGGWVERFSAFYTTTQTNKVVTVVVDGLTTNAGAGAEDLEFGADETAFGGFISDVVSVTWERATSPTTVSATPSGVSDIPFIVIGNQE